MDESSTDEGDSAKPSRYELQVHALLTELAILEWRARRLGLTEVAHFAGVAVAAAADLVDARPRRGERR